MNRQTRTDSPILLLSHSRLVSLDVLRGVTVALMILVNNAGDGDVSYPQLRHSVWNGCTLTDLVFPTFLFIVGASIVLAFQGRLDRGASRTSILAQVLKRSLLIFAIGVCLNALPFFHWADLRYFGVLQRIALCYLAVSLIYLFGGVRASIVASILTIAGYWWLLTHVPVPGFGKPGVDLPLLDRSGNLAAWLDRLLVPAAHLYHQREYDPEGLLSTVPAIGTTLLGTLSAVWLRRANPASLKATVLFLSGLILIAAGLLWSSRFPLNKRLWTSSYVLFTAGIAMGLLALLFWIIDGPWQWRRGLMPWLVFGTNALTAYIVSEVLATVLEIIPVHAGENLQQLLFHLLPGSMGPPAFRSMLYSVLYTLACGIPVFVLYRRKIFLKI